MLKKRKLDEFLAFRNWKESGLTQWHLRKLLDNLVHTGLMTQEQSNGVTGWVDLCGSIEGEWLSVQAFKDKLPNDEFPGNFLPVVDRISLSLVRADDAWYSPRLRRCFDKSNLLKWVMSKAEQRAWPTTSLDHRPLTLSELFSMGADPFNNDVWKPPFAEREAKLAADQIELVSDTSNLLAAVSEAYVV